MNSKYYYFAVVSLMPSFRSASVLVIVPGVFRPAFLDTVSRIVGIEPQILDQARMLKPGNTAMILRIPLPYIFPGAIAELMGATHGMGYYVRNSVAYANYAHAVAGIIVVSIFVTVLNSLTSVL